MSPAPFVERPEAVWFYCADCSQMYDGRYGHECGAADPLAPADGIFLGLCAAVVLWSLLYLAGVIRWGLWPFN